MHTLLSFNVSPNPNILIKILHDDEELWEKIINYLNDIIIWNIDRYKSSNGITHENHGKNNENIHHAP
jgi:hypothetical protein